MYFLTDQNIPAGYFISPTMIGYQLWVRLNGKFYIAGLVNTHQSKQDAINYAIELNA